ncbi:gamma-glutamyltransferase [Pyruvatibacter sp.]|uniref:gamma-glutamyltransferase n=1 Tax=Pyruvatibacter sp. TaxID=1981328 RepID=UPI003265ED21
MARAKLFFTLMASLVGFAAVGYLMSAVLTPQPKHMVSAAHPLASAAGLEMLERGGSAVDAAVAVQLVLTLVEPQSSGIGGGAFLVYWNEDTRKVETWDGRETAPASVTPQHFLKPDGKPMSFFEAVVGGHAVGVPGVVAMLADAHEEQGRLPWADLFAPAIRLAEDGFEVTPRLNKLINWSPALPRMPVVNEYFFKPGEKDEDGNPVPLDVGMVLANPAYAKTLRILAEQGPRAFYEGEIAKEILAAVNNAPVNPGGMTAADLASYKPIKREPVCAPYRIYKVCGAPPPTSGGTTVLQILGLLESFYMQNAEPQSADAIHLISEASRLAYADRNLYLADPDFVDVPLEGLLDRSYLRLRSRQIHPDQTSSKDPLPAGRPAGSSASYVAADPKPAHSTSHFVVRDDWGHVVSMTTSIEAPFGSHMMAGGFLLNNQLTDFSFRPARDGKPIANRPEAGKRPRSSMSPMIVLDENGDFYAAIGSPGGSRIIAFVAQSLIGILDWDMSVQDAINMPRHVHRNTTLELEENTFISTLADGLRARGHTVEVKEITSGLHGLRMVGDDLEGGADPRREGVVLD